MDQKAKESVNNLIREGENELVAKNYGQALICFQEAYEINPHDVSIIINMGFCYAKLNNFSHAEECFITALDRSPHNTIAKRNLARVLDQSRSKKVMHSKRHSSLKTSFQKPQQDKDATFLQFIEWGQECKKNENIASAIQFFEAASNIHPELIDPYLQIASCYEELHEEEKAYTVYEQALSIYPEDKTAQGGIKRCCGAVSSGGVIRSDEAVIVIDTEYDNDRDNIKKNENDEILAYHDDITDADFIELEKDDILALTEDNYQISPSLRAFDDVSLSESGKNGEIEMRSYSNLAESSSVTLDDSLWCEVDIIQDILETYKDDIADDAAKISPDNAEGVNIHGGEDMMKDELSEDADDLFSDDWIDVDAHQNEKGEYKREIQDSEKNTMNFILLTEEQTDALQELGNIGASHAATTLSTMLGTPIHMSVPEICMISLDEISEYIGDGEDALAIFTMDGEIQQAGYIIVQIVKESVIRMSAVMLGLPDVPREMNEMDESAVTEIGNIMVSSFLDGTAELLDIIMLPSPPRTIIGKTMEVIRDIVNNSDINCDNIVFFKTEMMCNDFELQCNLLMLPNQSTLYRILQMLEKLIEDDEEW